MPRLKAKRSAAQQEAAKKGTNATKKRKVARRSSVLQEEMYQSQLKDRQKEIKMATRGRSTSLVQFLLLFLMIINCQLQDGLGRYESISKIARLANKSPHRLSTKFNHYVKTGNVLVMIFSF